MSYEPSGDDISAWIAELEIQHQRDREADAAGWIVVTTDDEDGALVNAVGPFETPEAALIQAARCDTMSKKMAEGVEALWTHTVLPMFAPTPPEDVPS